MNNKNRFFILFLILIPLFVWNASKIVESVDSRNTDFFTFWLASSMSWRGMDPFSIEQWAEEHQRLNVNLIQNPSFLYPLPLSILMSPLGIFTLEWAFKIWVFISQVFILISFYLLLQSLEIPPGGLYIFPILISIGIFRPTILTLYGGQVSAILLLLFSLIIYFWKKGNWIGAAGLLPFVMLKPNLGFPIVALVGIWLVSKRNLKYILVSCIASGVFLVIGFLRDTNWMIDYVYVIGRKYSETFSFSPTIWGMAETICQYNHQCSLVIGAPLAALILGLVAYSLLSRNSKLPLEGVISISILYTLVLTTHTWPYDQLLLIIPILVLVQVLIKGGYPYLLNASIFLLVDLLTFILLFITMKIENEIWNVLVPLVCFALFILITKIYPTPGRFLRKISPAI